MKKLVVFFSVVTIIMGLMFTVPAFAGQSDDVLSENIKEADGTTGQDTNTGSGVKTGHIQDGAVTSGKIADGTVSTADIADGAINDAKITGPISGTKLGSHGHDGADIADGTITTPKISDGAVTDAKITGPISSSKISSTGLDADTVDGKHGYELAPVIHAHEQTDVNGLSSALAGKADLAHNHDGVYQRNYNNVIVVSADGNGDFTSPVDALNAISDASASNPYLVKIMPGVYDIGSNDFINTKQYVDIEGSGERMTRIVGSISYSANPVIKVNQGSEVRFLTVENIGNLSSPYDSYGVRIYTGAKLRNVTVEVSGGTHSTQGVEIRNLPNPIAEFGSPALINVTVDANCSGTCRGIYIEGANPAAGYETMYPILHNVSVFNNSGWGILISGNSSPSLRDVKVASSGYGVYDGVYSNGPVYIYNSVIEGGYASITNESTNSINIALSQLSGPIQGSGSFTCFQVYDESFNGITCP